MPASPTERTQHAALHRLILEMIDTVLPSETVLTGLKVPTDSDAVLLC